MEANSNKMQNLNLCFKFSIARKNKKAEKNEKKLFNKFKMSCSGDDYLLHANNNV